MHFKVILAVTAFTTLVQSAIVGAPTNIDRPLAVELPATPANALVARQGADDPLGCGATGVCRGDRHCCTIGGLYAHCYEALCSNLGLDDFVGELPAAAAPDTPGGNALVARQGADDPLGCGSTGECAGDRHCCTVAGLYSHCYEASCSALGLSDFEDELLATPENALVARQGADDPFHCDDGGSCQGSLHCCPKFGGLYWKCQVDPCSGDADISDPVTTHAPIPPPTTLPTTSSSAGDTTIQTSGRGQATTTVTKTRAITTVTVTVSIPAGATLAGISGTQKAKEHLANPINSLNAAIVTETTVAIVSTTATTTVPVMLSPVPPPTTTTLPAVVALSESAGGDLTAATASFTSFTTTVSSGTESTIGGLDWTSLTKPLGSETHTVISTVPTSGASTNSTSLTTTTASSAGIDGEQSTVTSVTSVASTTATSIKTDTTTTSSASLGGEPSAIASNLSKSDAMKGKTIPLTAVGAVNALLLACLFGWVGLFFVL